MATTNQPSLSPGIMVFRPTMQEFRDFSAYIKKMEDCGAQKFGIAKVIPPKEWYASRNYDMERIGKIVIESPIAQLVTGQQGLYQQFNIQQKPLTVKELKELAESEKYRAPEGDSEKMERAYWKNVTFNPPIYGADVAGSVYDADVKCWNINHLNTILDLIESEKNVKILGVNTAYLYFGMWKTSFAWHTEDMDLYSINYLHFGASKSWYAIPPEHGKRLETLAAGFFPGSAKTCSQFLRHKMTVISPSMLKKYSIPFYKMTQNAGEFMITFPYGYHSGYNQGFNCAESTNFASLRWIDFGKKAKPCTCRVDNVKIEMAIFVKKYQPKQYKDYMESLAKKKSVSDQTDEEKKAVTKKPDRSIKVKRYNRYPSLSGVESIAKHVRKETQGRERQPNIKIQKKQVIRKAKNILKKAEKARRESIGRKNAHSAMKMQGELAHAQQQRPITVQKPTNVALAASVFHHSSERDGSASERMRKLLEIKAEMEREMELKKSRLQNIRVAREQRHQHREVKQKLRKRERPPKGESLKIRTETSDSRSLPAVDITPKEARSQETKPPSPSWNEMHDLLSGLWASDQLDIRREIVYNKVLSKNGKRCAVCVYFDAEVAKSIFRPSLAICDSTTSSSLKSVPLVPEICFMTTANSSQSGHTEMLPDPLSPTVGKESTLVTCRGCCVTVHQSCYGLPENVPLDLSQWYCSRCQPTPIGIPGIKPVRCELCPLRGGAFKQTTSKRWAHIVCALAFYDVFFLDPKKRDAIDISSLNLARTKLKCVYCRKSTTSDVNNGACVQCISGKCAQSFHVTCSFYNGLPLYTGDWPLSVEVYCHKHDKARLIRSGKRILPEIQFDDMVYAKHKNGRYYKGKIESVDSTTFYYVVFEDGSYCHDLPPEDIVNYAPGVVYSNEEKVDVLWTDGVVYPSVIKSCEVLQRFEVIFEDGSTLSLKRGDIYREDEDLPKKIRSKLSCATETANLHWQAPNMKESPSRKSKTDQKKTTKLV